jgi:Na+/H+-dicarboxylate symporter
MFLALAVGLTAGMAASGSAGAQIAPLVRPIGKLWVDALTMTVVPLVFSLLVTGIADGSRTAAAGGIAWRALLWFAVFLFASCAMAAVLTETMVRIWPGSMSVATAPLPAAVEPATEWFDNIIPTNPLKAAAETAMVPLVVFALFFGFATARIETALGDLIIKVFRAIAAAMLVIVGWVLLLAPFGVAALAFTAGVGMGAAAAGALAQYTTVVSTVGVAATLMAYGWAALVGGMTPLRFARAIIPAQMVALGTQSSLACLPVMIRQSAALGIRSGMAGIILPLAVSLFRAASAAMNVSVAIYLAHASGLTPSGGLLTIAALVAVPVSLAAVGLPAQVSFFATIGPICLAVGAPITALPLLLAVEAIPDLFRTLGNVTNDLAVAQIVSGRANRVVNESPVD